MIEAIGSDRDKFRLLDLDLANNSLGAGCGELLAVALRRNKTLTRLSLRWDRKTLSLIDESIDGNDEVFCGVVEARRSGNRRDKRETMKMPWLEEDPRHLRHFESTRGCSVLRLNIDRMGVRCFEYD